MVSSPALLVAFFIGLTFGTVLEIAGFGSSKKLVGVFYFRDMSVIKVMFTAVVTVVIALGFLAGAGLVSFESLLIREAFFGAQALGGFLVGIGFVVGGWCPGTATVGIGSGKIDALVFTFGGIMGTMIYNELHTPITGMSLFATSGKRLLYSDLGVSYAHFAFIFTVCAVIAFWICEFIEERKGRPEEESRKNITALWVFSVFLILAASSLSIFPNLMDIPSEGVAQAAAMTERKEASDQTSTAKLTPTPAKPKPTPAKPTPAPAQTLTEPQTETSPNSQHKSSLTVPDVSNQESNVFHPQVPPAVPYEPILPAFEPEQSEQTSPSSDD